MIGAILGLSLALGIAIGVSTAMWQLHWALGVTAAVVSAGSFYGAVMEGLGRKLTGHRRDCICRKCWPSGHQVKGDTR